MAGFGKQLNTGDSGSRIKLTGDTLVQAAIQRHQQGDLNQAEKLYQIAIQQKTHLVTCLNNLGVIYKQTSRESLAADCYEKAILEDPVFVNTYINYANLLQTQGVIDKALMMSQKAIELQPDSSSALLNHGIILKDLGRFKDAEESIQKSLKNNTTFAEAYCHLGLLYLQMQRYSDARSSLEESLRLGAGNQLAQSTLGRVLLAMGLQHEGLDLLRKSEGVLVFNIYNGMHFRIES